MSPGCSFGMVNDNLMDVLRPVCTLNDTRVPMPMYAYQETKQQIMKLVVLPPCLITKEGCHTVLLCCLYRSGSYNRWQTLHRCCLQSHTRQPVGPLSVIQLSEHSLIPRPSHTWRKTWYPLFVRALDCL